MKAEFDKEIDSLLREGARRGRAAASGATGARAGDVSQSAHLDVDEQSAFAENALPVAARARYTAHLADCDECRRGVTRLALAAGMPAQLETREIATGQAEARPLSLRERLGALLAPRAWRYAVPALALLLVGAITLVVLMRGMRRDGARETSIAESNAPNAQRPQQQQAAQPEAHHAPQNGNASPAAIPGDRNTPVAPDSDASPLKEEIAANRPGAEVAPPVVTGAATGNAAPAPPPAPSSGAGAVARQMSGLPASTPAPVAESAAVTTEQEAAKSESGKRAADAAKVERKADVFDERQYSNRREQTSGPRRNEQARNSRATNNDDSRNRADNNGGSIAATTAAPAAAPPAAAAAKRARVREAERGKDENRSAEDSERIERGRAGSAAETRTVAGRRFRRQGDAWVDANYSAGQSYTIVRRNSEQFRALVADEPGLRRIVDALGGEVTVVWKGRAYRFR